jgi:hypothetical protein
MTLALRTWFGSKITATEQKTVRSYVHATAKRSEKRENGRCKRTISRSHRLYIPILSFAQKEPVPVWISDYVLAGYGTGFSYGCSLWGRTWINTFMISSRNQRNAGNQNIFFRSRLISSFWIKEAFKLVNSDFLNRIWLWRTKKS